MKLLKTVDELLDFVLDHKVSLIFCTATWVSWIAQYRDEIKALSEYELQKIAEVDVDDPAFIEFVKEHDVLNVPAFIVFKRGWGRVDHEKTLTGKLSIEKLKKVLTS
jgi:hypothetical protein